MAKKHGKGYPTHHTSAHPRPPHLTGSGNKMDGRYGKLKDKPERVVARGKSGHYMIEDGSREHNRINVHPEHLSKPGHTEQYPFRREHDGCNHKVPHAFRAHRGPHSGKAHQGHTAHGPMGHAHGAREKRPSGAMSSSSPLRFSGHEGAHRVGELSGGRTHYKDRLHHHWGKEPMVSAKHLPGNPNDR